jgi:hypothetical protein
MAARRSSVWCTASSYLDGGSEPGAEHECGVGCDDFFYFSSFFSLQPPPAPKFLCKHFYSSFVKTFFAEKFCFNILSKIFCAIFFNGFEC